MLVTTDSGSFEIQEEEKLIEALEKNGYRPEYHCRQGMCVTCRLTLKSGHISYIFSPLAYTGPNEILPCCCIVKSDISISIEHPKDLTPPCLFPKT